MMHKSIAAIIMVIAASPVAATSFEQTPSAAPPTGSASARYCLRVEPVTGSLIETVQCWTREQWAEQGVSVDQEWAKEGVSVKE